MVIEYKNLISNKDLFSDSTDQFLLPFQNIIDQGIPNAMCFNFDLIKRERKKAINPMLQLATPDDAKAIVDIYLDIYKGTYPYKEMENVSEIRRMIKSSNYRWLLFKDSNTNKIRGCFTYQLDFKNKRGYMRGFNIPPRYQGKIDSMKALIGSMIRIWSELKNKIFIWYSENRTAHTSSQYLANVCGIKPIAFLPNKDVFFNKVESDIMQIAYDSKVLNLNRSKLIPKIIPSVMYYYDYSNRRYNLGKIDLSSLKLKINFQKTKKLKTEIIISVQKLKFDYFNIELSFEKSDNYFKFLYNPRVNNIEKTEYEIDSLEELFVFILKFKQLISYLKIRYCEVFVSAYKPSHQQLFYNFGLRPRGYIPSWQYNPDSDVFEDYIIFNLYVGTLNDIKLIDQAKQLVNIL
ncbi:MAG: hypothetical protein KGD57_07680 [Candidatus Lokiarchaeota archaeon]|nr:hypothetical protein [Candidatus Lokiarchaeota archaeon]